VVSLIRQKPRKSDLPFQPCRTVSDTLISQPIYATLSDIVVYSPKGLTRSAFALAERFKHSIEAKARERERLGVNYDPIPYNVFVVTGVQQSQLCSIKPSLMTASQTPSTSSRKSSRILSQLTRAGNWRTISISISASGRKCAILPGPLRSWMVYG